MSCVLTQSLTLDCFGSQGGVVELYFIEAGNVTAITEASGNVSAITKTGVFRKYEQEQDTAFFVETLNSNPVNGSQFFTQEVTVVLNKMQVNTRNELLLLIKNRLICIAKDSNGTYWLLGKTRSLKASAGSGQSGTASADRNGFTFTFKAEEPELAPIVASGIIAGLLA